MTLFRETFDDHWLIPLANASSIPYQKVYSDTKKTVIYIHGYMEKYSDEDTRIIARAYQARGDYNILFLDWQEISRGSYLLEAFSNVLEVRVEEVLNDIYNLVSIKFSLVEL
jgi:hypothetical protein